MNRIQKNMENRENVLVETIERLKPLLEEFKRCEKNIGQQLSEAINRVKTQERIIGNCPNCGNGKLMILRSRKTGKRFIGCTNYFQGTCKTSFPLPQKGKVKPSLRSCRFCGWPLLIVRIKSVRSWMLCFNPHCLGNVENKKCKTPYREAVL